MKAGLQEIHPGEILCEEFLAPLDLSERALVDALDVPPEEVRALIAGQGPVTAGLARALAGYFKMSVEFWLNLQLEYEMRLKHGGRQ